MIRDLVLGAVFLVAAVAAGGAVWALWPRRRVAPRHVASFVNGQTGRTRHVPRAEMLPDDRGWPLGPDLYVPGEWTDEALAELRGDAPVLDEDAETIRWVQTGERGASWPGTWPAADPPKPAAALEAPAERLAGWLEAAALDIGAWGERAMTGHRDWAVRLALETQSWLDGAYTDLSSWRYETPATERWRPDALGA